MTNKNVEYYGYWGKATATIDWCEANYEITHYIAEFWNTISCILMIIMPISCICWVLRHNKKAKQMELSNEIKGKMFILPNSVIWCNIGLMVVGIGSWLFHTTLLYSMQLLDELPMIFCTSMLVYSSYEMISFSYKIFSPSKTGQKSLMYKIFDSHNVVIALILVYVSLFCYIYLFVCHDPVFHQITYAIAVAILVFQNVALIYKFQLKKRLYLLSFAYYMFGFLLWNIDNQLCNWLHYYRDCIDWLFSSQSFNLFVALLKALSEFHSWWHIFTGYGSFMNILFLIDVAYEKYLFENNHDIEITTIRPVVSKFAGMYYHINDSGLETLKSN